MSGIDRRTMMGLVGAAGAGMMLSGCKERKGGKGTKGTKSKPVGYCDVAGQSVRDLAPKVAGNVTAFAPRYICIVYVKFDPNWKLVVRRTYVSLTSTPSPAQVESTARQILARLAAGNSYNQYDKPDIDPIHLGKQEIVIFYIDNPPDRIRFKHNPADTNNASSNKSYDRTIRFVKFSASDNPVDIKENHAFFNIMKMNISKAGTSLKSDVAFRLDFWNTDEMGNAIKDVDPDDPDTHYLYSMNIHLEIASPVSPTSDKWIPVILDPDTGNMGAEP